MGTCIYCGRTVELRAGEWADMAATGEDIVWRYACDMNDSFQNEHMGAA